MFAGFELLRGIILEAEEWSPESGLTSPTLKLKRPALRSKYSFRLKALYDQLEAEVEGTVQPQHPKKK